jgi:hypothetical protein
MAGLPLVDGHIALRQHISQAESQLAQLKSRWNALHVPACRLPQEVLSIIFHFSRDDQRGGGSTKKRTSQSQYENWFAILAVCRCWRDAARSPVIWSYVPINPSTDGYLLDRSLCLSKGLPLCVVIRRSKMVPMKPIKNEVKTRVVELELVHFNARVYYDIGPRVDSSDILRGDYPALETLQITGEHTHKHLSSRSSSFPFQGTAPRLKSINLLMMSFRWRDMLGLFDNIIHLSAGIMFDYLESSSASEMAQVLSRLTKLETLLLYASTETYKFDDERIEFQSFTLPCLKYLDIEELPASWNAALFRALRAPQLQRWEVSTLQATPAGARSIVTFFRRFYEDIEQRDGHLGGDARISFGGGSGGMSVYGPGPVFSRIEVAGTHGLPEGSVMPELATILRTMTRVTSIEIEVDSFPYLEYWQHINECALRLPFIDTLVLSSSRPLKRKEGRVDDTGPNRVLLDFASLLTVKVNYWHLSLIARSLHSRHKNGIPIKNLFVGGVEGNAVGFDAVQACVGRIIIKEQVYRPSSS